MPNVLGHGNDWSEKERQERDHSLHHERGRSDGELACCEMVSPSTNNVIIHALIICCSDWANLDHMALPYISHVLIKQVAQFSKSSIPCNSKCVPRKHWIQGTCSPPTSVRSLLPPVPCSVLLHYAMMICLSPHLNGTPSRTFVRSSTRLPSPKRLRQEVGGNALQLNRRSQFLPRSGYGLYRRATSTE